MSPPMKATLLERASRIAYVINTEINYALEYEETAEQHQLAEYLLALVHKLEAEIVVR